MSSKRDKVGRNDLCPCGSTKKFKKCCIDKEKVSNGGIVNLPNIYQLIILKYFSEGHFDVLEELENYRDLVFDTLPDLNKSPIEVVRDYLGVCEDLLSSIAAKYSTYELLFWSRRLAPKNIFDVAESSVVLYREIQTLCIYKHGKNINDIFKDKSSSMLPLSMLSYSSMEYLELLENLKSKKLESRISDVISDVIRLEILSYLYLRATQLYRIGNKGGSILINKHRKRINEFTNEEISYLIDLYDKRLIHTNVFSFIGAYVDVSTLNHEQLFFCPHFMLNVDHKFEAKLFNPKTEAYKDIFPKGNETVEIKANYIVGGINVLQVYNFLKLFEEEFKLHYSFSVKAFVMFLAYLGNKLISDFAISYNAQFSILNRAYKISDFDLESFEIEFQRFYPELHEYMFEAEPTESINITPVLQRFLLLTSNKSILDLWTRGPKYFLYQISENFLVIDYSGLAHIVAFVLKEITSVDGEIGNRRAFHFEDMIAEEVGKEFGSDSIWVKSNEVRSGKNKKEIDASFVVEDILFLIEAKAVNVSFGFDKGDKKALDYRISKMKSALKESNEKAEFLIKYQSTIQPPLPKRIKFICPLVVSSNHEYIWSLSEELFISEIDELPRIITVEDLKKIKSINLEIVRKRNWVVKI